MIDPKPPTDYASLLIELRRLEKEIEIKKESNLVAHFLLTFDCSVETLEDRNSPEFLMNVEMPHSFKWHIILQQEDNPGVLDFRKRMQDLKLHPEIFCRHIDHICSSRKIEIKEDDWPRFFETLNIQDDDARQVLKLIVEFSANFEMNNREDVKDRSGTKACIHVAGIPREFTREQIEEVIKIDGFVDEMANIVLLKDLSDETKLKGEVVIIFNTYETAVKFYEKLNGKDFGNYVLRVRVY